MPREYFRIPLLRDSHTHPLLYAAFMDAVDLGTDPTESRERALARVRAHALAGDAGWAIAHGWNSGRYAFSKDELDDLPPLVIFNLSLHGLIVNDAGRALLARSEPELAHHLADQRWIERNLQRILRVVAIDKGTPQRLGRFFRWLLEEHGVYYAEEMLLMDEREVQVFEEAGLLERTGFWAAPEQFDAMSASTQGHIRGIKLFADGALGAWTAALHEPYRGSAQSGMLMYEQPELVAQLNRYLAIGKAIALHAIGDRAIGQVIAAVEQVGRAVEGRIRIEHAQFITEQSARRAKALGIHLCMQPNFSDDSIHYADRLPGGYSQRNNLFRMLIDHAGYTPGVDLWFGSDGMRHGFREGLRQSLFPPHAGQLLTIDEFVAGYCLPDSHHGSIEVEVDRETRQVAGHVVDIP